MFIFHEDIELLEGGRSHVRTKFDDEVEAMTTTTQIEGPTSLNQTLKATVVHRRTSKDAETRKKVHYNSQCYLVKTKEALD